MRKIYLRKDLSVWTLVDPEDYDFLLQWTWGLQRDNRGKLYARRYILKSNLYLHRVIMRRVLPAPSPKHIYVDHINNNGLDNRRKNLRWATASENAKNVLRNQTSDAIRALSADLILRGEMPPVRFTPEPEEPMPW